MLGQMIFQGPFEPGLFYDFTILWDQRKVSQQQYVPTEAKNTKKHSSLEAKSNKQGIIWLSTSGQYSIDQTQDVWSSLLTEFRKLKRWGSYEQLLRQKLVTARHLSIELHFDGGDVFSLE